MSEDRDEVTATPADEIDRPAAPADDIEALSTRELHDRAMHRAETHLDAKFFWSLLEIIPAAKAAVGDTGRADFDILHSRGQIRDALRSGVGPLAESLRPVFIDYLRKHPDA
jgi:hypothetical protein